MNRLHARYPFLSSAREAVEASDVDLAAVVRRDGEVVDRAVGRVENALDGGTVGEPHRRTRVELLSYPVARVLVSLVDEHVLTRKYARAEAQTAYDRFREEQSAMTDPVFLACIPDARVWGDPNVAVITPDDAVLAEVSNVFGRLADKHPVFQRRRLGPVRTLNGTSLLLAATEGRRYFHWMMDVLPRVKIVREHCSLSDFDHVITNPITSHSSVIGELL